MHPLFRMILPTAMMGAALLTIGGVAAWYLNQLQTLSAHLLFDSVEKVQAAEELEIISHELRYQLRHYLATHDENEGAKVAQLQRDVDRCLAVAGEVADTERERTLLDEIRGSYARLFGDFQHVLRGENQAAQTTELLNSLHDRATDAILKPAHEFLKLTRHDMEDAVTRQQSLAQRVGWELVLLGSSGAVAGLLLGYGVVFGPWRMYAGISCWRASRQPWCAENGRRHRLPGCWTEHWFQCTLFAAVLPDIGNGGHQTATKKLCIVLHICPDHCAFLLDCRYASIARTVTIPSTRIDDNLTASFMDTHDKQLRMDATFTFRLLLCKRRSTFAATHCRAFCDHPVSSAAGPMFKVCQAVQKLTKAETDSGPPRAGGTRHTDEPPGATGRRRDGRPPKQ